MKKLFNLLTLLGIAILAGGCAVSHSYGPYMGKVVEKGSGEPIDGAVVFIHFYTKGLFQLSQFEDAIEVLADQKGEFYVPQIKVNTRFPALFSEWQPGYVIIFKPGYGAYPRHRDVYPKFTPSGTIPENRAVTVKLPILKTREERKKNLRNISFTSEVPYEKWRNLFKYRNIENIAVGLKPYKDHFVMDK